LLFFSLSLHDALPISGLPTVRGCILCGLPVGHDARPELRCGALASRCGPARRALARSPIRMVVVRTGRGAGPAAPAHAASVLVRSEEHTSELQSLTNL